MASLHTLLSILAISLLSHTSALTNCGNSMSQTCICVWDLTLDHRQAANGQYHLSNGLTNLDREWLMDDVSQPYDDTNTNNFCSNPKMFWNLLSNSRWFLGEDTQVGGSNGICLCNANVKHPISDPLKYGSGGTCPFGSAETCCDTQYQCWALTGPTVDPYIPTITYGKCPQITNYCDTISVTANTNTLCNGVYTALTQGSIKDLDNEINIFQNVDDTADNKYIFFDHYSFKWVCMSEYQPCYAGFQIYDGADNDPGTPDPFKQSLTAGDTWVVSDWGVVCDPSPCEDVIFECDPPIPTASPIIEPTNFPIPSPTQNPSDTPTDTPIQSPTASPEQSPTVSPVPQPTQAPQRTNDPSQTPTDTPIQSPTVSPIPSPTNSPLRPGDTVTPSNSPITPYPSTSPTTPYPSVSPTVNPTDRTDSPTRGPLRDGETREPTTKSPSKATPTPRPTSLTFPPTGGPTKEPTDAPSDGEESGDGEPDGCRGVCFVKLFWMIVGIWMAMGWIV